MDRLLRWEEEEEKRGRGEHWARRKMTSEKQGHEKQAGEKEKEEEVG